MPVDRVRFEYADPYLPEASAEMIFLLVVDPLRQSPSFIEVGPEAFTRPGEVRQLQGYAGRYFSGLRHDGKPVPAYYTVLVLRGDELGLGRKNSLLPGMEPADYLKYQEVFRSAIQTAQKRRWYTGLVAFLARAALKLLRLG